MTEALLANEIISDAFKRIKGIIHNTVEGLSDGDLVFRPDESANSIAWLVWHLTRIQDDHISNLASDKQVWSKGWYQRFELPFDEDDTGYGHSSKQVASVRASSKLLLDYHDAVYATTINYVDKLNQKEYTKIVDKRWDPPVTLAVRLVSVISDDFQHAGQATYIRGLLK